MKIEAINDSKLQALLRDGVQRRAFTRLQRLAAKNDRGLGWHWEVGAAVRSIRGPGRFSYGEDWGKFLASHIGVRKGLLIECARLAAKFTKVNVKELVALKVCWAVALAALPLHTPTQRMRLLGRAARKGWSAARTRLEARRLLGTPQHPSSGRATSRPDARAPEVELHKLILRARAWTRFVHESWLDEGRLLDALKGVDQSGLHSLPGDPLEQARKALVLVISQTVLLRDRLITTQHSRNV